MTLASTWRKATFSHTNGCLEARWVKSTFSNTNGCVGVALLGGRVEVRNSRDRNGPVLSFTAHEWLAFLDGARAGEFDVSAETEGVTS